MRNVTRRIRCLAVVLILWAVPAFGEPYLGLREGMKCSACHTNVTGGGKRTDLVATHARDILRYPNFFGKFTNPPEFFSGEINQYLAIGSDLRVSNTATFEDKGSPQNCPGGAPPPVPGQPPVNCVDNNKVFRGRLETDEMKVTQFTLYGEVRLVPDMLTAYIDQRFQPTTDTREAFGLLYGVLPWKGFVKAGRFYLPYGLQLQDNGAFIREGTSGSGNTGFGFDLQESGGEFGVEPGPFSVVLALTNGPPDDRDLRVTGTLSTMLTEVPVVRNVLLGTSFSRVGPPGSQTTLFGFFAGTNLERLTVLGEADFRSDKNEVTDGETVGTFLCYGEADYLFFDWLNVKAAIDYADNEANLSNRVDNGQNRVSVGLEPFLTRYLQPRLFYRVSNGVKSTPAQNQNVLLAELHMLF